MALRSFSHSSAVALALWLLPPSVDAKVGSYWQPLPPLPTPRQEVGVAAEGILVYVIGGILGDLSATGIVERFDTVERKWESASPLPEGARIHHIGAASSQGLVFAIGGLDESFRGVKSVYAYDPARSAWKPRAELPRARGAMAVAAIEDKIYAAGGQDGDRSFDDFTVYHVLDDHWEPMPPMPTARNHLAGVSFEGVFYAVGGRAGQLFDKLEAFDTASKRWVELASMPTARGGIAAAVARDCIFVFGGEGNVTDPSGVFHEVEGYDICRNVWVCDLEMPNPRHGIGAAVVGDFIFIPGGSPVEGFGVTDTSDAYYPGSGGGAGFIRGDSNLDGQIDISDALFTLSVLFLGGKALGCKDAADTNDSGVIDLSDAVFGLVYLFLGGRAPPSPGPDFPGIDPTEDLLDCAGQPEPVCFEL